MDQHPAAFVSFFRSLPVQKRMILIGAGICIFIAYIGLNIGIWQYARNSGKAAQTVAEKNTVVSGSEQSPTPTLRRAPTSTPTPTPRPTGPGQYACTPIGTCNDYSDEVRKTKCTITYADSLCLDQCADTTKQCKN